MAKIYPFKAWLPSEKTAPQVASVPYDVVSKQEAKELIDQGTDQFLAVTRPDAQCPEGLSNAEIYRHGAQSLRALIESGQLSRADEAAFYIYALSWQEQTQYGFVFLGSVSDYNDNTIRKHEYTRPDKEDDRVMHMQALGAQTGTVFLCHRERSELKSLTEEVVRNESPLFSFQSHDSVTHRGWRIPASKNSQLQQYFEELGPIYIADGHHRSAAAARVAAADTQSGDGFLCVSFPHSELRILPYNRVVTDFGTHTTESFLSALHQVADIHRGFPQPVLKNQVGMYVQGNWFTISFDGTPADPVAGLDVSILQDRVLAPILGIQDPRTDQRIAFVGGIRGRQSLEEYVDSGRAAVAFYMHPTSINELLNVADSGQVMPPKSTWFEPKLRDGLFVYGWGDLA